MYSNLNNINFCIIGKPNSGKSTLFNCLIGDSISPVGDKYGLTKNLYRDEFTLYNQKFVMLPDKSKNVYDPQDILDNKVNPTVIAKWEKGLDEHGQETEKYFIKM